MSPLRADAAAYWLQQKSAEFCDYLFVGSQCSLRAARGLDALLAPARPQVTNPDLFDGPEVHVAVWRNLYRTAEAKT